MQQPVTPPVAVNPAPQQTITPVVPSDTIDTLLPWENKVGSESNRHNVRVICDLRGLKFEQKEILTACVKQESDFYPLAKGRLNSDGTQDFGIAQFNNGKNRHGVPYWIGIGATFSSIQDVYTNPQRCIEIMADYYKATGNLGPWASFNSYEGEPPAYIKWLGKV